MKKWIALILSVVLVVLLFPANVAADNDGYTRKPFTVVNNSKLENEYDYVYYEPFFYGYQMKPGETKVKVSAYGSSDPQIIAEEMKDDFNSRPEGARFFYISMLTDVFNDLVEDQVYFDKAVVVVRNWLEDFLSRYKAIGGKLDGISVDLEYSDAYNNSIHTAYTEGDKEVYNKIVNNPAYQTRVRPKLVEQGFTFWPADKIGGVKSEIWTMYKYSGDAYATDRTIWNNVMRELLTEYINEAAFEPMLKYYPDAVMSDYQRIDCYSWLKNVDDSGGVYSRNLVKVGNASYFNITYAARPGSKFYNYETDSETGTYRRTSYYIPPSFNDAVYERVPFNMALWDVNMLKRAQASTDTGKVSTCIAFFNYGPNVIGTVSNTPYYTETILHAGLLDPQPFGGYIVPKEVLNKGADDPDPNVCEYDYSIRVVNDIMAELTRVAGYSDRKPIQTPDTWNGSYLLSGMYAGGRNIWRITPDTTVVSVKDFKVKNSDPTFCVDGLTITFPGGKIIADGHVEKVGTCGYWVETDKNVTPIITATADRYAENPAFGENFDSYAIGAFTSKTAYPHTYWLVSGNAAIQTNGNSKALALRDTTVLANTQIVKNITAGDDYAKQQAWEVTVTLPSGDYGSVRLLRGHDSDGGFKIENGKVYYHEKGGYKELTDLSAGTYTFKREMDFRTAAKLTCTYYVYDVAGKCVAEMKDVSIVNFSIPVQTIFCNADNSTNAVLLDDYKLYPVGVSTVFEIFDTEFGVEVKDLYTPRTQDTAYRLSWMNASAEKKIACVYNGEILVQQVKMEPGMDGVMTGIVEAGNDQIKLTVKVLSVADDDTTAPETPNETDTPTSGNDSTPPTDGDLQNPGTTDSTVPSNDNTPNDSEKGGGVAWLIVILCVVVLGAAGFVVFKKYKGKKTETQE